MRKIKEPLSDNLLCLNCGAELQPILNSPSISLDYMCFNCSWHFHLWNKGTFCPVCFSRLGYARQIDMAICSNPACSLYEVRKNSLGYRLYYNNIFPFIEFPSLDDLRIEVCRTSNGENDYFPEFIESILRVQKYL